MTEHDANPKPHPASKEAGALGETEIEITPAMIAAGADVLWNGTSLDVSLGEAETLAERIIKHALEARRSGMIAVRDRTSAPSSDGQ